MTRSRLAFLLALLCGCCGCSSTVIPDPPPTPSQDEAEEIGSAIDNHTQDLLLAFNVSELLLFELPLKPQIGLPSQPGMRLADSCPTIDNDADLDGDGVPDDALFTFAGEACTVFIDSVGTFYQSGSIHIVDTGDEPGYHLTYDHFRIRRDNFASSDYSITEVNGTYDVTATTSSATLVEALSITTEERAGGATVTGNMTFNWTANFLASDNGFVDLSIPLPDGTLAVQGSMGWSQAKTSFPFTISTTQTLSYDSGCRQGPEFLVGRIQAAQTNVDGMFLYLQYSGCAVEPKITRTRPPS